MTLTERTTAALAWLDAQLAICNAATDGPWAVDNARGVMAVGLGWTPICYPFGSAETEYKDATFIAAAPTGYPAMLEGMKVAIEELQWQSSDNRIGDTGRIRAQQALDSILTKIESLQ